MSRVRAIARALAAFLAVSIGCGPEQRTRPSADPEDFSGPAPGAPSFQARLEFPTAHGARAKPTGLIAGDLDGDGQDEIVAATRSPGGIEIWSRISPVLAPAPEPRAFQFGDYPLGPVWFGDRMPRGGRALVAIASRETLELAVLDLAAAMRAPAGSALAAAWKARLPARPRAIASGDLGRDGKPEIAVISIEDDLFLYAGPEKPVRLPLAREHATCVHPTSDGERIAVGFQATRRIALLRPDGTEEKTADLPGLPRALAEVDLDGDGDAELLAAAGDDRICVFGLGRAGGAATWLDAPFVVQEVGRVPIAIEPANLHGRAAVVVLALHDQEVRILGSADGRIEGLGARAAGQRPLDLAVGDFDGDGVRDIAVANTDARRVGVLFGAGGAPAGGTRFASETRIACDRSPASLAAGDVDHDGDPDLAVLAAADETVSVLVNDGGGLVRRDPSIAAPSADALACADLDGDGKSEVAWLFAGNSGSSIVVQGREAGTFPIQGSAGATGLLFADCTGDGKPDALVADPVRGFVAVLENRSGNAIVLAAALSAPIPSGPRASVVLRSPDAGTRIAIAAGGPGESRGIVLAGVAPDGSGAPSLRDPTLLAMRQHPIALATGDLDGDGREDLAVLATESGSDSQGLVVPWIAKADGGWRALEAMPTGARPQKIAAGDLDGDGKAEILATAQGSHHVEVWLARAGDPVSFARGPDLGAGTGPLDLLLVDLDGDGRKEIAVANGFSDDVSMIRVR